MRLFLCERKQSPLRTLLPSELKADWSLVVLLLVATTGYFLFLGQNDLWRADEGMYGEAIREMLESGNFLEIYFNYEPRYNKPPLMYWLMAISAWLFGLNEWAARLPVVLTGLGAIWITYKLGAFLEGRKLGIVAALVMFYSFQFVIHTRIALPAVPLTFFFNLTIYWFIKAYHLNHSGYLWGGYLALGLTLLTKGFPFLIIIGAIGVAYVLFENRFLLKQSLEGIGRLLSWPGILTMLVIGLSWIVYMLLNAGDDFYQVYMDETVRRAFVSDNPGFQWKDLTFYLDAISWGFAPYSLTFFLGLILLLSGRVGSIFSSRILLLSITWFGVMYVVFTISRGKIPTYIIQAHPALSLFTAYFILKIPELPQSAQKLLKGSFILQGVVLAAGIILMVYAFDLPPYYYLSAFIPFGLWAGNARLRASYFEVTYLPFTVLVTAFFVFLLGVLPAMEREVRQYEQLAEAILNNDPEARKPVYMEDRLFHNLPFYIHRKVNDPGIAQARRNLPLDVPSLFIVPEEYLPLYPGGRQLWSGYFYGRHGESRVLEMMVDMLKLRQGEKNRFKRYYLLAVNGSS